jgi:glycosyltransferase involved in cell wall biosynthesis
MKILLCHTYYTQRGGEDRSFEEERDLLLAHGHDVVEYVRSNAELKEVGALAAAARTIWNRSAARDVARLIERERPDVLHATNTFPLISPAACHAAHRAGVAVVQALRNYRYLCASAYLLRDGRPCEDCVGRTVAWPAVRHRCYRGSAAATAAVVGMQVVHRALGLWRTRIDAFFTLTEFARQKFLDGGFPAERVYVKYNSVAPDPGVGPGAGGYVAFAGRLSPEKGVATLLAAWRGDRSLPPLRIAGDGPLAAEVQAAAAADSRIAWLGPLANTEAQRMIAEAAMLAMPSLWYETFGRTIAEAFAGGTPVVASRLGAMAELVANGVTGWHFEAGDAAGLAAAVRRAASLSAPEQAAMRRRAREAYEARFTPAHNYRRLLEIYDAAMAHRAQRSLRATRRATARERQASIAGLPPVLGKSVGAAAAVGTGEAGKSRQV